MPWALLYAHKVINGIRDRDSAGAKRAIWRSRRRRGAWAVSCGEGGNTVRTDGIRMDYLCHFYEKNSKRKPCSGAEGFCRITFGCKNLTRKADMLCPIVSTEETKKSRQRLHVHSSHGVKPKGRKRGFSASSLATHPTQLSRAPTLFTYSLPPVIILDGCSTVSPS